MIARIHYSTPRQMDRRETTDRRTARRARRAEKQAWLNG